MLGMPSKLILSRVEFDVEVINLCLFGSVPVTENAPTAKSITSLCWRTRVELLPYWV